MTQAQLAEAAGTSQKRIWEIETKASTAPGYRMLEEIADALHVPLELLTLRARVIRDDIAREST